MKTAAQKLCELVGKKYMVFTSRGNTSIKLALEVLKMSGKYKTVLIQDQGGWLTYQEYIQKLKFEKIELKTDYGLINPDDLKNHEGAILLANSMPGYFVLQDMEELYDTAKKNNVLLINDASGSIGTEEAKYGDIIIGSFGNAKPIEMGEGGFLATDDEKIYKEICELNTYSPSDEFLDSLDKKLDSLDDRLTFLEITRQQAIEDLKLHEIIHPAGKGINVIVKFNNEEEKNEIIEYCKEQNLECTICPRYIRVNCPAVSIEIKRLKEEQTDIDANIDEEYEEVQ